MTAPAPCGRPPSLNLGNPGCPDCHHPLSVHVPPCLACVMGHVAATLASIDQRLRALERDEGIRLI